jgi:hypothetical protein
MLLVVAENAARPRPQWLFADARPSTHHEALLATIPAAAAM